MVPRRPRKSNADRARELRDAAATRRLTNLERLELADLDARTHQAKARRGKAVPDATA